LGFAACVEAFDELADELGAEEVVSAGGAVLGV
jgi:hypothetical protein